MSGGRDQERERVMEERVTMKAKEDELEGKEHSRPGTWCHREDVRTLVEMQKEEEDQEGQRDRVAPNMGAGGSQ